MSYKDPITGKVYATSHNAQAATVRARAQAKIDDLRASKDLTPKARQRLIAQEHKAMREELGRIRETRDLGLNAKRDRLVGQLYSGLKVGWNSPGDAVAVRDAVDRASKIKTPEEAMQVIRKANEMGDRALAAAAGQACYERHEAAMGDAQREPWADAFMVYTQNLSDGFELVQQLAEIDGVLNPKPFEWDEFANVQPPEVRAYEADLNRDKDDSQDYEKPASPEFMTR